MVSGTPSISRMAALWRPRIIGPARVTIGRSWVRLSSAELQADQPMLSRKTSARPAAATNLLWLSRSRKTQ